jgi:hypothetical protein
MGGTARRQRLAPPNGAGKQPAPFFVNCMARVHITSKKPQGVITRGKTAANRLRRTDLFFIQYAPALIKQPDAGALFVDLGYGREPTTTLESAERLRTLNPALAILGVEIDPERVAVARPYADALTDFRLGGFNLPLRPGEGVRLMRAFNVLRQYDEPDFCPAYAQLARGMLTGGLMLEGTSDPFGRVWVANVARKTESGWGAEALVFSTNFRNGFDPAHFQPVLPKNYIHHVVPGEPIYNFFADWKRATAETAPAKVWGARQWFAAAAQNLAGRGYKINLRRKWIAHGFLIWELDGHPLCP